MLKPTVLLLLVLCFQSAAGQGLVLENNPATLPWNQISTGHFKVIFPEGFEAEGQRVANTLEHLHGPVSETLGKQPRPIPIVLQNQGVISNGFVTLGPRRSEFFTSPPQDYKFLGNNDWLNLLATHEFRHIVQFDKSLTGMSEAAYWMFGEDVLSVLAFISTPLWLWEGDAVGIETALSPSGRGRIPYFQALHRANVLDRGGFRYQKQYLRSYKHQIPNHYLTGYLMTTFLRRTYGEDILDRVTERSFRWPIIPFTFSTALKKETGLNLQKNYRLMSREMDSLYRKQLAALELTGFDNQTKRKGKLYTEYAYPQLSADGSIVAVRYGIGNISQLVQRSSDGEWKLLHTLGVWEDNGYLSSGGGKVAWNEIFYHPRWERVSYSGIRVLDVESGELTTLGRRQRYKGAGISPDGSKVVTIETDKQNNFRVLLLDAVSGEVLKAFPNPSNLYYSMPQFSADGRYVILLKHAPPQKSVVSIEVDSGVETEWLVSSTENLGHPVMAGDWLFYASDISGIDNIYALHMPSKDKYQVTSSRLGAYNPFVGHDGSVYYNEMTKDGWDIARIPLETANWTSLENAVKNPIGYFEPLVTQEAEPEILATVPENKYEIRKYHQYKHLFRPYGWGWVNTLSDRQIELGLYSQNVLSTTYIDAGYNLNLNEGTGYWTANVSYQGLPVIIDAGATYGTRSAIQDVQDEARIYTWNEKGVSGGLRVPFNFTRSAYLETASVEASVSSTEVENYSNPVFDIDQQRNGILYATRYRFNYSRLLKQSKRDIYPRWGQSLALTYFDTPFKSSDYFSTLWSGEAYLYLPGFFKHHSVRLRGAYQNESINNYRFKSEVQYIRGFTYTSFKNLTTTSVNYALPLLYPDLSLGPFVYLQRIRANGFYDYGRGSIQTLEKNINSFGIDLFADFNIMRYLSTFSAGARLVYVPEQDAYLFSLLLGSISL